MKRARPDAAASKFPRTLDCPRIHDWSESAMWFHKLPISQNLQILVGVTVVCAIGAYPVMMQKSGVGYDSMADKKAPQARFVKSLIV